MRLRGLLPAIAAALLTAGCGVILPPGFSLARSDLPSGLPVLRSTQGLTVVAACPNYDDTSPVTVINVYGIDPVTWAPRSEAVFTLAANVEIAGALGATLDVDGRTMFCTASGGGGSFADITGSQVFNKQFTLLAVQVTDPATGYVHIGYLNRAGHITLFGAGHPAHDYNPVFDPSGTKIWYVSQDDGHVYTQSLNGAPPFAEGGPPFGDPLTLETPVIVGTPGRALFVDLENDAAANPAATVVAMSDDQGRLHLWRPGRAAVSDEENVTGPPVSSGPAGLTGPWQWDCDPDAWVDNSTLLCGDGNNFWTLTLTGTHGVRAGRLLLPASAANNNAPLVLPGGRLALYNNGGYPDSLHELALVPGTPVAKVGQDAKWLVLGTDYRVLSWS